MTLHTTTLHWQRLERTAQQAPSVSPSTTVTRSRPAEKKSIDEALGRWDKKARVYSNEAGKDTDKRVLAVFSKYDPAGRGVISKSDVQLGLRDLGIQVDSEAAGRALVKIGVADNGQVDLTSFIMAANTFKAGIAGKAKEQSIAESLWELVVMAVKKVPSLVMKIVKRKTKEEKEWVRDLSNSMADPTAADGQAKTPKADDEKGTNSLK